MITTISLLGDRVATLSLGCFEFRAFPFLAFAASLGVHCLFGTDRTTTIVLLERRRGADMTTPSASLTVYFHCSAHLRD
jgi:hypothetical protein